VKSKKKKDTARSISPIRHIPNGLDPGGDFLDDGDMDNTSSAVLDTSTSEAISQESITERISIPAGFVPEASKEFKALGDAAPNTELWLVRVPRGVCILSFFLIF
jgi:hypothetical protein